MPLVTQSWRLKVRVTDVLPVLDTLAKKAAGISHPLERGRQWRVSGESRNHFRGRISIAHAATAEHTTELLHDASLEVALRPAHVGICIRTNFELRVPPRIVRAASEAALP